MAHSSSPLFAPRARRITPPSPLGLAFGPAYGFGSSAAHLYSSPAFSATSWPLIDVEVGTCLHDALFARDCWVAWAVVAHQD